MSLLPGIAGLLLEAAAAYIWPNRIAQLLGIIGIVALATAAGILFAVSGTS